MLRFTLNVMLLVFLAESTYPSLHESNSVDDEENPFLEAAKSLLQDSLAGGQGGQAGLGQGLGTVLQSFMQSDGAKSGLGSIVSGLAAAKGSVDPQVIGQLVSMFAGAASDKSGDSNQDSAPGLDWNSMIDLASGFMSANSGGQGSTMEGFMHMLPALVNAFSGGHQHSEDPDVENQEEHDRHARASSFLPPFLSSAYVYWEHFRNSELGTTLWKNSGLGSILQLFIDRDGHFQVDKIFESLENATFRRRWVRSLTSFVAEWIKHVSDPSTQARYLSTTQFIMNGFLKSQGYAKAAQFDQTRPAESLSFLADAVFKRQFGLKINSATYIKPAIAYIQDVFRLGQSKGFSLHHLTSKEIEDKLSELLNHEIIDPVLRVWRVYRFASKKTDCDRYLVCSINRKGQYPNSKTGLKPGVTKLSSLIASWFLSGRTGTPFWKLYNAATEDHNCAVKYPANCQEFHEEDLRATTEYFHNEL
ncbi:uncharacterized protein LOC126903244 [Daktulosphaira vitifoliae]|uniref:uncharacterized protein LOC126903244 n=1 Tax=Daktulosphaira vitifoliae TaxID=58002 RepID=UPI0021A9B528|nr:uncharacterized protein LOC126903244 [Daktulosphaira vitifoliae]